MALCVYAPSSPMLMNGRNNFDKIIILTVVHEKSFNRRKKPGKRAFENACQAAGYPPIITDTRHQCLVSIIIHVGRSFELDTSSDPSLSRSCECCQLPHKSGVHTNNVSCSSQSTLKRGCLGTIVLGYLLGDVSHSTRSTNTL